MSFGDELGHAHEATRINFKNIEETIEEMIASSRIVEGELKNNDSLHLSADDKFREVMSPFALQSSGQLKMLQEMMYKMKNCCSQVGEYFAFDTNKYSMEQCFLDISAFEELFARTYEQLEKSDEMKQMKQHEARKCMNKEPEGRQQQGNEESTTCSGRNTDDAKKGSDAKIQWRICNIKLDKLSKECSYRVLSLMLTNVNIICFK